MNAEKTADNIARWLRDYAANHSKDGYVVGLSGGVDSAVAAALAVRGAGAERVLAMLMPCYSDEDDARLGKEVAEWLGITCGQADLATPYDALTYMRAGLETGPVEIMRSLRMAEANIKPRLRMIALYYLATAANYLVLGTSNLSERMLGYFTKHGDGAADVFPLGQLYKTEVWELAKYLGVPQEVIDRPPSGGLWPGQTDEDEIGFSYEEVDGCLREQAGAEALVDRMTAMNAQAQHKLYMPPMGPGASA